jgi:hypothetical protein
MCWELILRGLAFCPTDWAVDARTRCGTRDTEIIGAGSGRRCWERRLWGRSDPLRDADGALCLQRVSQAP